MIMDLIEEFLDDYIKPQTIRTYRKSLEIFFEVNKADKKTYFDDGRDYDHDLKKFMEYMQKYKPITRKTRINCVRAFLDLNNVKLNKKTKKIIKRETKKMKPSTQDIVSKPAELKKILQHGTLKDRALFLFLSSSGLRIDEALQLTVDDIPSIKKYQNGEPISYPVKVYLREETTKTDTARITYISNEAWETLLSWLKDRPRYLVAASKKSKEKKSATDDRIFPYTYPTALRMWHRLIEQSGLTEKDQSTGRYRRHIHTLRKYFRIYLAPKAGEDVTELLLGHMDKLSNVYRDKYPEEKLAEMYTIAMADITVFASKPDLKEINDEITKLKNENQSLRNDMQQLMAKILSMDDKKKRD